MSTIFYILIICSLGTITCRNLSLSFTPLPGLSTKPHLKHLNHRDIKLDLLHKYDWNEEMEDNKVGLI